MCCSRKRSVWNRSDKRPRRSEDLSLAEKMHKPSFQGVAVSADDGYHSGHLGPFRFEAVTKPPTVRRGSLTPPKPPTVGLTGQFCYGD